MTADNFIEDDVFEKKLKELKKKHMNPFQGVLDIKKRIRVFFLWMNDNDMDEMRDLVKTMQYARDKALNILK